MKISKAQAKLLSKMANDGEAIVTIFSDKHNIALELVQLGLVMHDVLNICMVKHSQRRFVLVNDCVLEDAEDVKIFMSK